MSAPPRLIDKQRWAATVGRFGRVAAFPFLAQFVQPEYAQIEVVAKTLEHGVLVLVLVVGDGAGDVIGALAVLAVIDEPVEMLLPLITQRLGIDAGPEEREVADVTMHFATRVADSGLGLHEHFGHGVQSAAGRIAKGPTLVPGCFDINSTA